MFDGFACIYACVSVFNLSISHKVIIYVFKTYLLVMKGFDEYVCIILGGRNIKCSTAQCYIPY